MNGGLGFVLGGLSRSLGANKGKGSPRFNTCASVRRGQIVSFARIPEKVQVVLKVLCCGWRSIIRDVTRVSYGLLALAICALAAPGTAHAAFQLQRRAQGSELIAEAPPAQQERKIHTLIEKLFFEKKKQKEEPKVEEQPKALPPITLQESHKKKQSSSFVTRAVQSVGPSVVRIDTERTVTAGNMDPLLEDPLFKKFFGDELNKVPRERLERGQGSGFIISTDGLLITNAHVVKGADKVTVTLTDGRSYVGAVKGTDDLLDLAVVKIESKGKNLPVALLGVSNELEVGDWVIAVGNPVGLDNTVTLGIVSSLNRSSAEVGIPEKRLNFIQTDAAINPGNSGGPLVNEFGQVVGINTAIRANAEGIGFAIPIDRAKDITQQLAEGNKIQHAYIGVKMLSLTPEFAKQNNEDPNALAIIPEVEGAIVVHVVPKSPAAEAGLRRFDIIQVINGKAIHSAKEVQAIVDKTRVGETLMVNIMRGPTDKLDLKVKTGDLSTVKETGAQSGRLQDD
uniref:PDZ domain-containing protein n=3 Tax=Rhodosorus marinus TaxID=101924 RepID=A0A7S3A5R7_9RHOD|mmetsp:Transcript_4572/g.19639  ORF Transcript_4572/g.19639 Transcript_4572/m.19639 type:complete len:510 (+) Transcript_4572:503-2032(+)|eukprot:CAMPEP_0113963316 /NCGR_PEP_ID=MMETSP0011_2-20120614/6438_1 /TAXON_ID=101924 /ORGANISM="Rhodosorus marinus" /LENGTH=509 /DNA_ID=CAMNT_0000975337 /DNA_START=141 /DNA_END=1670 /DNA_ORIENTATION=+ /assembly_acc=CAM_ASM_000156